MEQFQVQRWFQREIIRSEKGSRKYKFPSLVVAREPLFSVTRKLGSYPFRCTMIIFTVDLSSLSKIIFRCVYSGERKREREEGGREPV